MRKNRTYALTIEIDAENLDDALLSIQALFTAAEPDPDLLWRFLKQRAIDIEVERTDNNFDESEDE